MCPGKDDIPKIRETLADVQSGEYAYGGDFGRESGRQDRNFIVDGILFPDRTPHPAYQDAPERSGLVYSF